MTPENLNLHDAINIPFLHDLKNTLEFDRKCRHLETVFQDLTSRIQIIESEITKIKN